MTSPLIRRSYRNVNQDGYRDLGVAKNSSAVKSYYKLDLMKLDQATQSTCTASWILVSRPDRIVLTGEHYQLMDLR